MTAVQILHSGFFGHTVWHHCSNNDIAASHWRAHFTCSTNCQLLPQHIRKQPWVTFHTVAAVRFKDEGRGAIRLVYAAVVACYQLDSTRCAVANLHHGPSALLANSSASLLQQVQPGYSCTAHVS
jgi:hypothetical protein